jgi:DNA-binding transcriptional LysR family regulator
VGSGASQAGPSSHVVDGLGRPDAAPRLRRFREEHPDIEISWRNPWEAEMTEPDGAKRWVMRYELHDLLDEVECRLAQQAMIRSGCVDQA